MKTYVYYVTVFSGVLSGKITAQTFRISIAQIADWWEKGDDVIWGY